MYLLKLFINYPKFPKITIKKEERLAHVNKPDNKNISKTQ